MFVRCKVYGERCKGSSINRKKLSTVPCIKCAPYGSRELCSLPVRHRLRLAKRDFAHGDALLSGCVPADDSFDKSLLACMLGGT